MVEPKTESSPIQGGVEQTELFDFTSYPEQWAFTTRRICGRLISKGVGWYTASKGVMYECEFEYRKDGWTLIQFCEYETGEVVQVPGDVEKDLYREFAYHKARWMNERKQKRQLQGEFTRSTRRMGIQKQ